MDKLLILGATGRTGKWLVKEALERGYLVSVLVRHPEKLDITNKNLRVFTGLTTNKEIMEQAIAGCSQVISALNISRHNDFPWSSLRSPKLLLSETMKVLIEAGRTAGIQKIIILSAWGVGDSRTEIPWWFSWLIDHSNIKYAYDDHARQESLLINSEIDHLIIRPVGLTSGRAKMGIQESYQNYPAPKLTISRRSLARWLIANLDRSFQSSTVVVSD
ncbi:hypothetical protein EWM62_00285 [Mucilaginibacter terrigena]|uniref:NAD(P)-binding domain-containing protein n=1 Tax=Mucilaginibacter terrigena TaxID=2492395 RepID=A0A4Q5LR48_9SPHI|nr:NAD(P)H-binding protein [Mucilaginibacter terrigena]RYU91914.1 hypothetical protein EWM62_00285 [Mucilaginibacter terrigena]